ncbi:hypothetical protein KKH27_02980 [bacterium]|nr:hypothetical protein [bacterium]MBU1983364.1 hypothetical protein [bacterium]
MISHRHKTLFAIACAAILGALLISGAASPRTAAQTSAEMRGLIFHHGLHTQQGLECSACHNAQASTIGRDDLLPAHANCSDCHDVEEKAGCGLCHRAENPKLSPRVGDYSPKFSHQRHVEAGKLECAVCHADLDAPLAEGKIGNYPGMAECMDCHAARRVKNECMTCHLATEDLIPLDHKLDWINHHGVAANTEAACAQCHKSDDCQKCHSGDPVFMPHPRNYMSRHGQDAHLSDVSCSVCHDERDFCTSCHRQMNVLPVDHFKPGWATPPPSDGGTHSEQALFDLESCMACHDTPGEQPVCARCHRK